MPIYEFVCQDCGHEFEKIQSFSDSSVPTCPNCQGLHVQRRLSAPAIHFKGSGWYITDSKNSAKTSATGGANSETKSEGAKDNESKAGDGKAETGKSEAGKSEAGKSEPAKQDTSKQDSSKQDRGSTSTKTSAD